jgi:hypothetical protein
MTIPFDYNGVRFPILEAIDYLYGKVSIESNLKVRSINTHKTVPDIVDVNFYKYFDLGTIARTYENKYLTPAMSISWRQRADIQEVEGSYDDIYNYLIFIDVCYSDHDLETAFLQSHKWAFQTKDYIKTVRKYGNLKFMFSNIIEFDPWNRAEMVDYVHRLVYRVSQR